MATATVTPLIKRLAKRAKNHTALKINLPVRKLAIQETPEYIAGSHLAEAYGINYPMIEEQAFKRLYLDEQLGLKLPVFAFFHVDKAPKLKQSFRYSNGRMQSARLEDTSDEAPNRNFAFFDTKVLLENARAIIRKKSRNRIVNWSEVTTQTFSTELGLVIPESVVDKIVTEKEKKTFNRGLFVVADVSGRWKVKAKTTIIKQDPDPLVIGIHQIKGQKYYYLVDQFDLSPLESYITKEFIKA